MVAHERGLGIRYWMTTGNEVDLSVGETIQMMAEDPEVHTIMAYAESVKDGEQFTKALDAARSEKKPVIFMKVGRSEVGAAAANSHTASLAGEDVIYCLLYTSDAADDSLRVDLGGRRIIKKLSCHINRVHWRSKRN